MADDELFLSARLAEAAQDLQARARAHRSLLTLELVHADDDLCAAQSMLAIQQRKAEQSRTSQRQLNHQLVDVNDQLQRATCERVAVLGSELSGVEDLVLSLGVALRQAEEDCKATADRVALELEEVRSSLTSTQAALAEERTQCAAERKEQATRYRRLEMQLADSLAQQRASEEQEGLLSNEVSELRARVLEASHETRAAETAFQQQARELVSAMHDLKLEMHHSVMPALTASRESSKTPSSSQSSSSSTQLSVATTLSGDASQLFHVAIGLSEALAADLRTVVRSAQAMSRASSSREQMARAGAAAEMQTTLASISGELQIAEQAVGEAHTQGVAMARQISSMRSQAEESTRRYHELEVELAAERKARESLAHSGAMETARASDEAAAARQALVDASAEYFEQKQKLESVAQESEQRMRVEVVRRREAELEAESQREKVLALRTQAERLEERLGEEAVNGTSLQGQASSAQALSAALGEQLKQAERALAVQEAHARAQSKALEEEADEERSAAVSLKSKLYELEAQCKQLQRGLADSERRHREAEEAWRYEKTMWEDHCEAALARERKILIDAAGEDRKRVEATLQQLTGEVAQLSAEVEAERERYSRMEMEVSDERTSAETRERQLHVMMTKAIMESEVTAAEATSALSEQHELVDSLSERLENASAMSCALEERLMSDRRQAERVAAELQQRLDAELFFSQSVAEELASCQEARIATDASLRETEQRLAEAHSTLKLAQTACVDVGREAHDSGEVSAVSLQSMAAELALLEEQVATVSAMCEVDGVQHGLAEQKSARALQEVISALKSSEATVRGLQGEASALDVTLVQQAAREARAIAAGAESASVAEAAVEAAQEQARDAVRVAVLEKAEAVVMAESRAAVAAAEVDTRWRAQLDVLTSMLESAAHEGDVVRTELLERLSAAEATMLATAAETAAETAAAVSRAKTEGQVSCSVLLGEMTTLESHAEDQVAALRGRLVGSSAQLSDAKKQLQSVAVEAAVARAEQLMSAGNERNLKAINDALREEALRLEARIVQLSVEVDEAKRNETTWRSELDQARDAAAAAANEAAIALSTAQHTASERERLAVCEAEERALLQGELAVAAARAEMHADRVQAEAALRAELQRLSLAEIGRHEAGAAAALEDAAEAALGVEHELRMALELKHASASAAMRRHAQKEVAAARQQVAEVEGVAKRQIDEEVAAVRQQAKLEVLAANKAANEARAELEALRLEALETGATQEEAMDSTESECRRLYSAAKAAEQAAAESATAAERERKRADELSAALDAATMERVSRARQSGHETMHVRSLASQVEMLGAALTQTEAALEQVRAERRCSFQLEATVRNERDEGARLGWQLAKAVDATVVTFELWWQQMEIAVQQRLASSAGVSLPLSQCEDGEEVSRMRELPPCPCSVDLQAALDLSEAPEPWCHLGKNLARMQTLLEKAARCTMEAGEMTCGVVVHPRDTTELDVPQRGGTVDSPVLGAAAGHVGTVNSACRMVQHMPSSFADISACGRTGCSHAVTAACDPSPEPMATRSAAAAHPVGRAMCDTDEIGTAGQVQWPQPAVCLSSFSMFGDGESVVEDAIDADLEECAGTAQEIPVQAHCAADVSNRSACVEVLVVAEQLEREARRQSTEVRHEEIRFEALLHSRAHDAQPTVQSSGTGLD